MTADSPWRPWAIGGLAVVTLLCLLPLAVDNGLGLSVLTVWALWVAVLALGLLSGQLRPLLAAFLLYLLALHASNLTFGPVVGINLFAYFALSLVPAMLCIALDALPPRDRLRILRSLGCPLLFTASMLPPFSLLFFSLTHHAPFTMEVYYAVFQTSIPEAIEYLGVTAGWGWLTALAAILVLPWALLWASPGRRSRTVPLGISLGALVLLGGASVMFKSELPVYDTLYIAARTYADEVALYRETLEKRRVSKPAFDAVKREGDETYLVVIGESLNRDHMGLYGYVRNTTPRLDALHAAGELLVFDNAYSVHTHTDPVMSLALTQANQLNGLDYFNALSVIEVLRRAGIETTWITNQQLYGAWDNKVSIIAQQTDHLVPLNHSVGKTSVTQKLDGALLPEVTRALDTTSRGTRVIFVHLIGNHQAYCSRFPTPQFRIFSGPLDQGIFGSISREEGLSHTVNCYDNSVVYNDHVVASILEELQGRDSVAGLIYFSDHADDVFHRLGHLSTRFTFEMTRIPLLMWFSGEYRARHPDRIDALESHRTSLFSNGFIYDTILGIVGVETGEMEPVHDLSSAAYRLEPQEAFTLDRRLPFTAPENTRYWQDRHARYLLQTGQASRVYPHRVDSVGKLRDIWRSGFRSFEIDVIFDDRTKRFRVGHNPPLMGVVGLDRFLESVEPGEIQRIWLDLKNLGPANVDAVLERLEELDARLGIKGKTLVESGTRDPSFRRIRRAGWETSYYLPTHTILRLLQGGQSAALDGLAEEIRRQIGVQATTAVSFDIRLHPFVRQHLEPIIPRRIVYHVWLAPPLASPTFVEELEGSPLFQNPRIRTLLTPYRSVFDL